jgi:hypothetical protein
MKNKTVFPDKLLGKWKRKELHLLQSHQIYFTFFHRLKIDKEIACGVWNSSASKYAVSFVFCSFPFTSLNVLVSFLNLQSNFYKGEKSSLTQLYLHTEMSEILIKLNI